MKVQLLSCLALLPWVLACSGADDSTDSTSPVAESDLPVDGESATAPLLQIDVGEGRTVQFYDYADGTYAVAEMGPIGTDSALAELGGEHRSLSETFAALRPEAELLDALAMADAARSRSAESEPATLATEGSESPPFEGSDARPEPNKVAQITQPWTYQQFVSSGGCTCDVRHSTRFSVCRKSLVRDYWAEAKTELSYFRVAHQSGNGVRVNSRMSGNLRSAVDVPPGYWWNFWMEGPTNWNGDILERTMRYEVVRTSGDTYHVGGCWQQG